MIENFFTTAFTLSRMSWSDDSSEEIAHGNFSGHIQQATAELAESVGLAFNKTFMIWCAADEDVQEGDTVNDGSFDYSVRAIQKNNYGTNTHLQIIIERHENYASV